MVDAWYGTRTCQFGKTPLSSSSQNTVPTSSAGRQVSPHSTVCVNWEPEGPALPVNCTVSVPCNADLYILMHGRTSHRQISERSNPSHLEMTTLFPRRSWLLCEKSCRVLHERNLGDGITGESTHRGFFRTCEPRDPYSGLPKCAHLALRSALQVLGRVLSLDCVTPHPSISSLRYFQIQCNPERCTPYKGFSSPISRHDLLARLAVEG
jgi:hypothetical protein